VNNSLVKKIKFHLEIHKHLSFALIWLTILSSFSVFLFCLSNLFNYKLNLILLPNIEQFFMLLKLLDSMLIFLILQSILALIFYQCVLLLDKLERFTNILIIFFLYETKNNKIDINEIIELRDYLIDYNQQFENELNTLNNYLKI
jgi:hypothetical protein